MGLRIDVEHAHRVLQIPMADDKATVLQAASKPAAVTPPGQPAPGTPQDTKAALTRLVALAQSKSGDDAGALDALTSWLVANPDVKVIVPVGGTPHRNLPAALKAAGNTTTKVIGFDTSPQVVQGLKDGVLTATADQQGYIQGFQSVMQTILNIDFGFSAANINSGGLGLITKDTVGNIEAPDLQGVRF